MRVESSVSATRVGVRPADAIDRSAIEELAAGRRS
jgi:hypothetical protein